MQCKDCKWWDLDGHLDEGIGLCRLKPPDGALTHRWPSTGPLDWCGEHELSAEAAKRIADEIRKRATEKREERKRKREEGV